MRVILITGISGSGKSIATKALEDDGFLCIDNLPLSFLFEVIDSLPDRGHDRVAVSIDARGGDSFNELGPAIERLTAKGHDVRLAFLDARTETLVQRYSETRRRHPMSLQLNPDGTTPTLTESIECERELMSVLEGYGVGIDTTDLLPNALRTWIRDVAGLARTPLVVLFESFPYKHGVPLDADLIFDARCLPNPHYVTSLRARDGRDPAVIEYFAAIPRVARFIDDVAEFLVTWLPHYLEENRSYLSIAIGCTGGRHRSVYCVEELAKRFARSEQVLIRHRAPAISGKSS
ncbi:MAG: RNase adapter RapZ [Burkholderiaceae bacterium]|nr:RNase adapter RapZ [Burkholderiaceae bacterium]